MKKRRAFTLIELLVVVAIIALLISILLPSLSRARELSKRLVCSSNAKGQGTAYKIYANDFEESWPVVPFNDSDDVDILYIESSVEIGFDGDSDPVYPNPPAKPNRQTMSDNSATTLSVTRSLWMLVRSGDVTPKQYVCPSSGESVDPEQNLDKYYDFKRYESISYAYQVPYGPYDSRATEDIDPRMAVGGDKGPYYDLTNASLPVSNDDFVANQMTPQTWKEFNSPNHGGVGTGEGQNLLFGDGHASFEKQPIVGVDQDNVYTVMNAPTAGQDFRDGRLSGNYPNNFYPGEDAFPPKTGGSDRRDAITDSLIYP